MTDPAPDPRPQPRWGQYADVPPAPPQPVEPPPPAPPLPEPPKRRTGDVVLTTLLLLIGVYDVVVQWPLYASLGASLRDAYVLQGFGEFTSIELADSAGAVLNIARAVLIAVTVAWSLLRIARHQRAFWVPLGAGLLAALLTVGVLIAVMVQDPALMEYVQQSVPSGS